MSAFLDTSIYDAALNVITGATKTLYICSSQPTTLTEANTTYKLGTKTSFATGSPVNGTTGRKITSTAFTDGVVNTSGTAGFFGIGDGTKLLVAGPLAASQGVTSGNSFSLAAFDIAIPAPA